MSDSLTIPKRQSLTPAQDYDFLRAEALKYIEQFSHKLWTDYNIHDPGITLAELLCYAITDLGYRTNFKIEDLLARPPQAPPQASRDFFTARQILTCNPVTLTDFRKLVIDQAGVQNAWLASTREAIGLKTPSPDFWYWCQPGADGYHLNYDPPAKPEFKGVQLNGLYNVLLELEEHPALGDLNENVLEWPVKNGAGQTEMVRVVFPTVDVIFPRWEEYPVQLITQWNNVTTSAVSAFADMGDHSEFTLSLTFDSIASRVISFPNLKLYIIDKGFTITQADIIAELDNTGSRSFAEFLAARLKAIMGVMKRVYCALHAHRNLCEDYVHFTIVPTQEIMVCADIEVSNEADIEEVMAKILFLIDRFLAPPVRFYNLGEMLTAGTPVEEIFTSLVLNHGFIKEAELEANELRDEIHVSDIYRLIMSLPEVKAVTGLQITNYLNGVAMDSGEEWCLKLGGKFHLNLSLPKSKITFYKNELPYYASRNEALLLLETYKAEDSKPKIIISDKDLPVPEGVYVELRDYVSVQNDLPEVYKTGRLGISPRETNLRKAQVKQLKAYLLFFDHLLLNYLGQLDMAKDLLSCDSTVVLESTYSALPPWKKVTDPDQEDFPLVANLIRDFTSGLPPVTNLDDEFAFAAQWAVFRNNPANGFLTALGRITEDKETYEDRRNRFLDHLLARFGESFADYALLVYRIDGKKSAEELVRDKQAFLNEYPEISRDRGKAFEYKYCCRLFDTKEEKAEWDTENVSGLQKRLTRLLGIDDWRNQIIGYTQSTFKDDFKVVPVWTKFRIQLYVGVDHLMNGLKYYDTKPEGEAAAVNLLWHFAKRENYYFKSARVYLRDNKGNDIFRSVPTFANAADATLFIEELHSYILSVYFREGMHILEHILLRPVANRFIKDIPDIQDGFFPQCLTKEDCDCPVEDYYSFRLTIVLPYWPDRFRNMNFRNFAERTIRLETPAHIVPKICWVDVEDMLRYERAYQKWLDLMSLCDVNKKFPAKGSYAKKLDDALFALIKVINTLTSVYPEGVLHDCTEPSEEESIILNRSVLGTFNDIEDETP